MPKRFEMTSEYVQHQKRHWIGLIDSADLFAVDGRQASGVVAVSNLIAAAGGRYA